MKFASDRPVQPQRLVPTAADIIVAQRSPGCPERRAELAGAAFAAMRGRNSAPG